MATKQTKSFIIIFASFFIGSFYLLKLALDNFSLNLIQETLLSSVISGLFATLITPFFIKKGSRKPGLTFLLSYVIFVVLIIFFTKNIFSQRTLKVEGVWENNDESFKLDFFKQDSLRLISPSGDEKILNYKWEQNKLQVYEEEDLLFSYNVTLDHNKLIVSEGKDELIFHKKSKKSNQ